MKIIFEDENFLMIDKPAGLVVHSDGRTEEKTLTDWVKENYPELESVGNPHTLDSGRYSARFGVVNRLDRDTSGLILIAKNEVTFLNLQKQFLDRTIKKEYRARVWGIVKLDGKVLINEPISRHKKDPRIWVCGSGVGERQTKRSAETFVEVVDVDEKNNQTILKLNPITGRTHQLRLHCRFIGHPIVGDEKYGINGITNEHSTEQIDGLLKSLDQACFEEDKKTKLQLRAVGLEFVNPTNNEIVKISA
jgi:23S rRNA pseudouridine1911/1915/1917 synthase